MQPSIRPKRIESVTWMPIAASATIAFLTGLTPTWSQSDTNAPSNSLPPLPANGAFIPESANSRGNGLSPTNLSQQSTYQGLSNGYSSPTSTVAVVGPSNAAATGTHLMSTATLSNGAQQVVLIDPSKMTLVVYHVDPTKGDVQLKSVRKIDADFSLEEFNLSEPTPSTIRKNIRPFHDR
ncbi:MAG: hypothetical protein FJ308_15000 [Planctomycetes bacterium]|nr:hypothetical protein [Planctomycetota bacterium]